MEEKTAREWGEKQVRRKADAQLLMLDLITGTRQPITGFGLAHHPTANVFSVSSDPAILQAAGIISPSDGSSPIIYILYSFDSTINSSLDVSFTADGGVSNA